MRDFIVVVMISANRPTISTHPYFLAILFWPSPLDPSCRNQRPYLPHNYNTSQH